MIVDDCEELTWKSKEPKSNLDHRVPVGKMTHVNRTPGRTWQSDNRKDRNLGAMHRVGKRRALSWMKDGWRR